jgi:hypothetical protein
MCNIRHLSVFNQVISNLKRVDVKFEDEDKALMLLNSLPASTTYENLVTTLTWGKESLELEDVTGVKDLKRVDVKFEDEDKALILLNSLPTSTKHENSVTTLT